jgi:hypothetical protein
MTEKQAGPEAAESDGELPLAQPSKRSAVQAIKRPTAAVRTFSAEPCVIKAHKTSIFAMKSKQNTRGYLLMVLGKKPTPTARMGGLGSAKKDASYEGRSSAWFHAEDQT